MTQQIHTIESITSQQGVYLDNITVNGKNTLIDFYLNWHDDHENTYQYQEVVRKASKAGNPPLINLATSLGRKFVKHCRDTSRVVFNPCLKSDVVKVFQHIYTLKDGEDPKKLYYYVGKKEPMKFTLVNACHIRRITVLEGALDDDFKKFIFDQLSVNFIRNNDYTVVPFLRKYIEEFKKLNSQ